MNWNPSYGTPPNYKPPSLSGADPIGSPCFPYGYVFPHRQEIQFKNGNGNWKAFYLHINGLLSPGVETPLIGHTDVWFIDLILSQSFNNLVLGNVEVRYRNNLMNTSSNGGPCVSEPADTWIYETWYLN